MVLYILIFVIIVLLVIVFLLFKSIIQLNREIQKIDSRKRSLSTRYGQIFEQLVPFAESFPFDVKKFRFIGNPIDGIVFDDDKIVFCEIKLGDSKLTAKQEKIKNIVKDKKVEWTEIRG